MVNGTVRTTTIAPDGEYNWITYLVYFLFALAFTWAALFVMLRTRFIPEGSWLWNNTTWIPGLGSNSYARQT